MSMALRRKPMSALLNLRGRLRYFILFPVCAACMALSEPGL